MVMGEKPNTELADDSPLLAEEEEEEEEEKRKRGKCICKICFQ
jgi:hypothetical protein